MDVFTLILTLALGALLIATWLTMAANQKRLTQDIEALSEERTDAAEMQTNIAEMATQVDQVAEEVNEALATLASRTAALAELVQRADQAAAALREETEQAAAAQVAVTQTPPTAPLAQAERDEFAEIRRLAAAGMSATEIARRTQRGREEVRLVLGLAAGQARGGTRTTERSQEANV